MDLGEVQPFNLTDGKIDGAILVVFSAPSRLYFTANVDNLEVLLQDQNNNASMTDTNHDMFGIVYDHQPKVSGSVLTLAGFSFMESINSSIVGFSFSSYGGSKSSALSSTSLSKGFIGITATLASLFLLL